MMIQQPKAAKAVRNNERKLQEIRKHLERIQEGSIFYKQRNNQYILCIEGHDFRKGKDHKCGTCKKSLRRFCITCNTVGITHHWHRRHPIDGCWGDQQQGQKEEEEQIEETKKSSKKFKMFFPVTQATTSDPASSQLSPIDLNEDSQDEDGSQTKNKRKSTLAARRKRRRLVKKTPEGEEDINLNDDNSGDESHDREMNPTFALQDSHSLLQEQHAPQPNDVPPIAPFYYEFLQPLSAAAESMLLLLSQAAYASTSNPSMPQQPSPNQITSPATSNNTSISSVPSFSLEEQSLSPEQLELLLVQQEHKLEQLRSSMDQEAQRKIRFEALLAHKRGISSGSSSSTLSSYPSHGLSLDVINDEEYTQKI